MNDKYFESYPMFFQVHENIHRVDVPAPWLGIVETLLSQTDSIESAWLSIVRKLTVMSISAYEEAHPEAVVTFDELNRLADGQQ